MRSAGRLLGGQRISLAESQPGPSRAHTVAGGSANAASSEQLAPAPHAFESSGKQYRGRHFVVLLSARESSINLRPWPSVAREIFNSLVKFNKRGEQMSLIWSAAPVRGG